MCSNPTTSLRLPELGETMKSDRLCLCFPISFLCGRTGMVPSRVRCIRAAGHWGGEQWTGGGLTPTLRDFPPWEERVGNPQPKGKRTELGHAAPILWLLEGRHIPVVIFPAQSTVNRRYECWFNHCDRVGSKWHKLDSTARPSSEKGRDDYSDTLSLSGDKELRMIGLKLGWEGLSHLEDQVRIW